MQHCLMHAVLLQLLASGLAVIAHGLASAVPEMSALEYAEQYDAASALRRQFKASQTGRSMNQHRRRLQDYSVTFGPPGTFENARKAAKFSARAAVVAGEDFPVVAVAAKHFGAEPDAATVRDKIYALNHERFHSNSYHWDINKHIKKVLRLKRAHAQLKQMGDATGQRQKLQPALEELEDTVKWHETRMNQKRHERQRKTQEIMEEALQYHQWLKDATQTSGK